jgi:hypothetical protein
MLRSKLVIAAVAAAVMAMVGTASVAAAPQSGGHVVKMRDTGNWCC